MTKDSRLERFLKALCSLDYSDLPTPLSRVEVLWSCLVTGETAPDFQPQSRTEKYLMSILGVYDLEDIPQPISRAEMLLYKLATGDTNVELEGGAKSRYEELLAEIVGKGEIGYTDFYYTTHTLTESLSTLYNTAEAPVKSAILKGNTKFRDIDTGDILDTFDETKNLELVSVKMPVLTTTGKNLFDGKGLVFGSNNYVINDFYNPDMMARNRATLLVEDLISVTSGSTLTLSFSTSFNGVIQEYGYNSCRIKDNDEGWFTSTQTLNLNQKTKMVNIYFRKTDNSKFTSNDLQELLNSIQLEESSTATSYEPYKSNILTTSEEVELRRIGDVRDELNLLTGELTQRIGEVVLNGNESWQKGTTKELTQIFHVKLGGAMANGKVLCDKIKYTDGTDSEVINLTSSLYVGILKTKASTIADFKTYLSSNPLTIQYQLATESVKTVDLSILNQDGEPTELKTFDDITHVGISSNGLLPELETTVLTKNIEQLTTMGLRMNDILDDQERINDDNNALNNDLESTMLATTEIYEDIL